VTTLITDGLAEITRRRHSILLAESKIHHVLEFATRLYIVERGENIFASPRAPCGQIPRRYGSSVAGRSRT